MATSRRPFSIGMVLFPNLTQLDLTGPYEVFVRMPHADVALVSSTLEPVRSEHGLSITPTVAFADAPDFDLICVPGGYGIYAAMQDSEMLDFLRKQAQHAQYITSVCTGSLILGAAGLLKGYRATTHWLSLDLLPMLGAEPVAERVVIDRNRITGGGVTSGIDFGLVVARELHGEAIASEIQLLMEYDPQTGGSPRTADPQLMERVVQSRAKIQQQRRELVEQIAQGMITQSAS